MGLQNNGQEEDLQFEGCASSRERFAGASFHKSPEPSTLPLPQIDRGTGVLFAHPEKKDARGSRSKQQQQHSHH